MKKRLQQPQDNLQANDFRVAYDKPERNQLRPARCCSWSLCGDIRDELPATTAVQAIRGARGDSCAIISRNCRCISFVVLPPLKSQVKRWCLSANQLPVIEGNPREFLDLLNLQIHGFSQFEGIQSCIELSKLFFSPFTNRRRIQDTVVRSHRRIILSVISASDSCLHLKIERGAEEVVEPAPFRLVEIIHDWNEGRVFESSAAHDLAHDAVVLLLHMRIVVLTVWSRLGQRYSLFFCRTTSLRC